MKKYLKLFWDYKKPIIAVILAVVVLVGGFNLFNQSKIDVTFYQVHSDSRAG